MLGSTHGLGSGGAMRLYFFEIILHDSLDGKEEVSSQLDASIRNRYAWLQIFFPIEIWTRTYYHSVSYLDREAQTWKVGMLKSVS
jgi:alpha-N-acetylglucosamine transferase